MAEDAVSRRDRQLLREEWLRANALFNSVAAIGVGYVVLRVLGEPIGLAHPTVGPWAFAAAMAGVVGVAGFVHHFRAVGRAADRRFISPRLRAHWLGCEERLRRFREALKQLRKEQVAEFSEMPKTIERVGETLYQALRRADLVLDEIGRSEGWMMGQAPPIPPAYSGSPSHDAQAQELYRIADRNLAEYRAHYAAVIAGVQRTEAQAVVFSTTLDTIRLKMLGYRLTGRKPDMSSQDLLEAMAEAKLQLKAIDSALEELELGPYPTMVAVMPPDPASAGAASSGAASSGAVVDDAARARLSVPPPPPADAPNGESVRRETRGDA